MLYPTSKKEKKMNSKQLHEMVDRLYTVDKSRNELKHINKSTQDNLKIQKEKQEESNILLKKKMSQKT